MTENKEQNIHKGHKARLRQKALKDLNLLADHEILELILNYGITRKDTNKLAHMLLYKFGTIQNVFDAPLNELTKIDGLGEVSASLIKLIPQLTDRFNQSKIASFKYIKNLEQAVFIFKELFSSANTEVLYIACLSETDKVISIDKIAMGNEINIKLQKTDVFNKILTYKPAKVIIAHNHLFSTASPSFEDEDFTFDVKDLLDRLGIILVEHIIINTDGDYSFILQKKLFNAKNKLIPNN
jgi:DNA repair protein RadC